MNTFTIQFTLMTNASLYVVGSTLFILFAVNQEPNETAMMYLVEGNCQPVRIQGIDRSHCSYILPKVLSISDGLTLVDHINS